MLFRYLIIYAFVQMFFGNKGDAEKMKMKTL